MFGKSIPNTFPTMVTNMPASWTPPTTPTHRATTLLHSLPPVIIVFLLRIPLIMLPSPTSTPPTPTPPTPTPSTPPIPTPPTPTPTPTPNPLTSVSFVILSSSIPISLISTF